MTFDQKARAVLSMTEYNMLSIYMQKGGHPLSPATASSFYGLFLNGTSVAEIHRLNRAFPYEAVLWARVKYGWDRERDTYLIELQNNIKEKLLKSQIETASLLSDMLTAATIKHGDKLKKYIQTRDEKDLGDAINIDSIQSLLKAVEGIQKITGQDKTQTLKKEETLNLNVNQAAIPTDSSSLSAEGASKILAIFSEEKRKAAAREKK